MMSFSGFYFCGSLLTVGTHVVMGCDQIETENCDRMFKGNKEAKKLGYLDADVEVA